ncbi:MAG: RraA family protein [Lachnospiraceae bacterium]|nr:RraA family protein [Lachnospiraceae bacterium]
MTHEERLKMFEKLETGAVTDAMVQLGVGSWMEGIYPTEPGMRLFGRAVTAQFSVVMPPKEPVDQFELITMAKPGDVLVWNVPSKANICGENIMHFLGNHKLNGLLIDGYTRDYGVIQEMGIPQFTRGRAIAPAPRNCRSTKEDVNVPVTCGGAVVNPGDYVFGDLDGVLVVPEKAIDAVLYQAELNMAYEKRMEDALNANVDLNGLREVFKTKVLYQPEK